MQWGRSRSVSLPRRVRRVRGAIDTALATGMGSKKPCELSLNESCLFHPRNVLRPNYQLIDNLSLHLKYVRMVFFFLQKHFFFLNVGPNRPYCQARRNSKHYLGGASLDLRQRSIQKGKSPLWRNRQSVWKGQGIPSSETMLKVTFYMYPSLVAKLSPPE